MPLLQPGVLLRVLGWPVGASRCSGCLKFEALLAWQLKKVRTGCVLQT